MLVKGATGVNKSRVLAKGSRLTSLCEKWWVWTVVVHQYLSCELFLLQCGKILFYNWSVIQVVLLSIESEKCSAVCYCMLLYVFSCDQAALRTLLSVFLSVCLSVRHTFFTMFPSSYHHENYSLPTTDVMSMQKVKVRGQRSRSQRSKANLAVSGP